MKDRETSRIRRHSRVRSGLIAIVALAVVWGLYAFVPSFRHDAADYVCGQTLATGGTYSTRWVTLPYAHWECTSAAGREPAKTFDLGWWPQPTLSGSPGAGA